jgi:predicted alpha/beta hydrolase family esterase
MADRVIIVHGWDGAPEEGWFPWLKGQLKSHNIEAVIPTMPHPERPTIEDWITTLRDVINEADEQTFLVGHSIGCQTILRYLSQQDRVVGGAIFVGGWFTLSLEAMPDVESREIAAPWLDVSDLNFERVRRLVPHSVAIFSDNDPLVPRENEQLFTDRVGSEVLVVARRGHFSGEDGILELPEVWDRLLAMIKV